MNDLRNSVVLLFIFLLMIFGVAQVNYVEENLINFSPLFFVLVSLAVISGLLAHPSHRFTIYLFTSIWAVIYGVVWLFYWRTIPTPPIQVHIIQFMLVLISAGLAFDVGRQMAQVASLVRGLTARTYPNRTLDMAAAEDRINSELTRSRRYQHPLSLLLIKVDRVTGRDAREHPALQRDILAELASAKVGQIINERARDTDLIIRDEQGRFLILCPSTPRENSSTLARRIKESVSTVMGTEISWGSAFFPTEALTFEDLLLKAEQRLKEPEEDHRAADTAVQVPVDDPAKVNGEETL